MLRVVGHFENEILYHFNQNGSLLSNHNLGILFVVSLWRKMPMLHLQKNV